MAKITGARCPAYQIVRAVLHVPVVPAASSSKYHYARASVADGEILAFGSESGMIVAAKSPKFCSDASSSISIAPYASSYRNMLGGIKGRARSINASLEETRHNFH